GWLAALPAGVTADGFVRDSSMGSSSTFLITHNKDAPAGATAVAKALERSPGAVGNCLARLAAAGQVRQVSEKPRRYSAIARSGTRGRTRRPRKEQS
ncbi:MAG: hypothetical protein QOF69_81, partial [Solirubrobacteraceae bacterium]|nr:hypothetical protein [Solirubrobacteraceae bacterium]